LICSIKGKNDFLKCKKILLNVFRPMNYHTHHRILFQPFPVKFCQTICNVRLYL
jgi:hypothetical protein